MTRLPLRVTANFVSRFLFNLQSVNLKATGANRVHSKRSESTVDRSESLVLSESRRVRGTLDQPETTMTAVTTFVDGIHTSYCELPPHFMSLEVGKTLYHW